MTSSEFWAPVLYWSLFIACILFAPNPIPPGRRDADSEEN